METINYEEKEMIPLADKRAILWWASGLSHEEKF